jgi:hypothetical protein
MIAIKSVNGEKIFLHAHFDSFLKLLKTSAVPYISEMKLVHLWFLWHFAVDIIATWLFMLYFLLFPLNWWIVLLSLLIFDV